MIILISPSRTGSSMIMYVDKNQSKFDIHLREQVFSVQKAGAIGNFILYLIILILTALKYNI